MQSCFYPGPWNTELVYYTPPHWETEYQKLVVEKWKFMFLLRSSNQSKWVDNRSARSGIPLQVSLVADLKIFNRFLKVFWYIHVRSAILLGTLYGKRVLHITRLVLWTATRLKITGNILRASKTFQWNDVRTKIILWPKAINSNR